MTLRLQGLCAGYDGTPVLRDVSLVVPSGSVVALLGANGAGKTTLLRAASGMIPVTRGSITLDGVELTAASSDVFAKAGVGHIPEGRSIFAGMTVQENLLIFAKGGRQRAAIERATELFPRLGQRLGQVAGSLSGGEQQMLALARCWIAQPQVLLVDEVSLGLSPTIVDTLYDALQQMVTEGTSLLLVEQYVTKALKMADYTYILKKGTITFAGEPCELDAGDVFREYVGADVVSGS